MLARLALAATALSTLAGCAATPSPPDQDRRELVTGSHIAKKYRPGDDNVQIYKPTPADMANIRPGMPSPLDPPTAR